MEVNFDDLKIYEILMDKCKKYGADPSASIEMEEFMKKLLHEYDKDSLLSFEDWLDEKLKDIFISIKDMPDWIQGYEWPVSNGVPMRFIGQVNISAKQSLYTQKSFHDDTSFYLFIPNGRYSPDDCVVIIQQY